ncbi:MAG: redoxin family protein [Flavobacteriales bacterium]|nr:redoxin family protein [Flavobacteriales bacterium]
MRKIYTLILSVAVGLTAQAQTPPDFTVTDSEGNSLNLYSALSNGKTIMLDFFFTTCPTCIANVDNIEHIYQQFGAGTGDFDIWGIDDRSSDAQVNSYKAQQGVTNPCVSGNDGGGLAVVNSYASNYNFTGFPTYAVICSDQSITWDIWPISTNAPEIKQSLESDCGLQAAGIEDVVKIGFNAIYPNPSSDYATVSYRLLERAKVSLEVYNMLGSLVKTVTPGQIFAGQKQTQLNVKDLENGNYFVKLIVNDELADVMKLTVMN